MKKPTFRSPVPGNTRASLLLLGAVVFASAGCANAEPLVQWPWSKSAGPKDSMGLKASQQWIAPEDQVAQAELDEAKRLFDAKEFEKAQDAYHTFTRKYSGSTFRTTKKIPQPMIEDAMFHEAEAMWQQKNNREAAPSFRNYVKTFPNGRYANFVNQRMFQIADYWLQPTREQMKQYDEKRKGERSFVMPASYIHFSKDMPTLDVQTHALQLLEDVRLNDIKGDLGCEALFYIATVKFFNEDFKDADFYYAQVYEQYPKSPKAPKAIKQSIVCKLMSQGGTNYDTRALEECRKVIHKYVNTYPELAKEQDWMKTQMTSITHAQADRDFHTGEYYRRTGHPASAYFYYELVRRRYPGTKYAEQAQARLGEIKSSAESEQTRLDNPQNNAGVFGFFRRNLNTGVAPTPVPGTALGAP